MGSIDGEGSLTTIKSLFKVLCIVGRMVAKKVEVIAVELTNVTLGSCLYLCGLHSTKICYVRGIIPYVACIIWPCTTSIMSSLLCGFYSSSVGLNDQIIIFHYVITSVLIKQSVYVHMYMPFCLCTYTYMLVYIYIHMHIPRLSSFIFLFLLS